MNIKCVKCQQFKKQSSCRKVNNRLIEFANLQGIIISMGKFICSTCYLNVYSASKLSVNDPGPSGVQTISSNVECSPARSSSTSITSDEEQYICPDIPSFNDTLKSIGSSPINRKKMRVESYKAKKFQEVSAKIADDIFQLPSSADASNSADMSEMIQQFKNKFENCTNQNERYMVLTTLPKSWSVRKIEREFNVSHYTATRAKQIQEEHGIMSTPNIKCGSKTINPEIAEFVQNFYEDDEISRVCAGKRDFETITTDGVKITKQRRLVLCNLKEAHQLFKRTYPLKKVGFSTFASMRPRHCVLANSSGTHCICVRIYHQNIKLMFNVIKTKKLLSHQLESYRDLISQIVCGNSTTSCYLNECTSCPGTTNLYQEISTKLLENDVDEITYKQWQQTDRCTIETTILSTLDFTDKFCEQLQNILPHSFIAEQQSAYLKHRKSNLENDECVVICDFSENYSFIVQDAVQGFHWSNTECTIHPFAVYYKKKDENSSNNSILEFTSLIAISESTKHNHVAVRLFIQGLVDFIKAKLSHVKKICFFSNGSGAQYKNRMNFYNLCNFKENFNIQAEWHFFATSHGKGSCDALGGVLKRNAARASLQRPFENQITTPHELYSWAMQNESKVNYQFYSTKDYNIMERRIKNRYNSIKQIPGTQQYHSFVPIDKTSINIKKFSFCENQHCFNLEK